MSNFGTINVKDQKGWSKSFPLEKALTLIGSAPLNDIVLSNEYGGGVANVHLQLISAQTGKNRFRLVNLVNEPLLVKLTNAQGMDQIKPKGSRFVEDGDSIIVGDFQLTFYLQSDNGIKIEKMSENIGLKLEMPSINLRSNSKLNGLLTVTNYGPDKRCQFEIDIVGLPSDCYQIDPAPLLYPGAEEKLEIRFFHQLIRPQAGECAIQIHAYATNAYPTEEVIIPIVLDIEPVYKFSVDIHESLDFTTKKKYKTAMVAPIAVELIKTERVEIKPDQQPDHKPEKTVLVEKNEKIVEKFSPIEKQALTKENEVIQEETDLWTETLESLSSNSNADPLAGLNQKTKTRLMSDKSRIQVLKAEDEETDEVADSE